MLQNLISMMFYILFVIYAMFGSYSLALNKDARLNRVFACLCFCFSIWSFAFALVNSANTYEEAMIWRRISALGWGVGYSLILHFFIVLTESNWSKEKRRPIMLLTLYVPSVLIIFFFCLYAPTATEQIQLVHTAAGWTTIPSNNVLEKLFYCYYLSFSLVSLLLLTRWYRESTEQNKKNQARYMLIAFCTSLLLGSFTDVIANNFLPNKLPSMAPVFIMISIATIFYVIQKYGLMLANDNKSERTEGVILNTANRTKLFNYVGIVLAVGSSIIFLVRLIQTDDGLFGVILSCLLVITGSYITLIPHTIKTVENQERLLTILIAIILPIIMLVYANGPFTYIIWPGPIFIIMITMIFNNRQIFNTTAIVTILMGIILWFKIPVYTLQVGSIVYGLRLLFYIIAICVTAIIKKIYIDRLEANAKLEEFQQLISNISEEFVNISSSDFDTKIKELIERSGRLLKADRSYMGIYTDSLEVRFTHKWIDERIVTANEDLKKRSFFITDWCNNKLLDNQIVEVSSLVILPAMAKTEREQLNKQGIYSQICIPIHSKDSVIGFIGFDHVTRNKKWQIDDHEMLRLLTNILADAIAKVENEKEIKYLAYYDPLTCLPNRVLFCNRLEEAIELAKKRNNQLGVMFLDIDGFKEVNDTLGHDWGDYLLNEIGKRLSGCLHKHEMAARFGGDEFLIMIPHITENDRRGDIPEQIISVFRQPVTVGEQEFYISASAGVAVFPDDGETVNELIKNADLAMYAAKNNGKGQYAFCSSEMKAAVLEKANLSNSLNRALERNELFLNYQPQVEILSQEVIGFEALLRWRHPKLGMIPPGVFIPIAEQTGLINSIGEWVLLTACAQNKAWQEQGYKPLQMAVNLSLEQFRCGNVEKTVKKCLEKTGLEPQYLELEITEGIAMKESRFVIECLHNLKKLGVAISIDDFGTEFSSLSRLKVLPVDRLKIDMQFIKGIGINTKDESIIAVMVHLAKKLGLKVIAEGVETVAQMSFLKDENCDEIQGYYYYKPMSADAIEADIYQV